jgi:pimeloyl-ACP methyl ester carboxylesterase
VGHAFGSRVARCLAADRPELVRRVVLPAAGGLVPTG